MFYAGHNVKDYGNVNYEERGIRSDVPDKIKYLPEVAACSEQVCSIWNYRITKFFNNNM